ncbi:MAG: hypothetical protein C0427_16495 [Rhodobacter sp.]|nr:hypothetical protein [Rhodobacter sp.]
MKKPSKDVLDKFKVEVDLVDVMLDGMWVQMPRRVAEWMFAVFRDDKLYQYQKDIWDLVNDNPLPKP